jgi:PhnB protein
MRLGPPSDGIFRAMLEIDSERAGLPVDFLKRVFEAAQRIRLHEELGSSNHWQCELRVGDTLVRIVKTSEGPPPCLLLGQLIVRDSDAMFARAVKAGACVVVPNNDASLDRRVIDPFGTTWVVMARVDGRAQLVSKAR